MRHSAERTRYAEYIQHNASAFISENWGENELKKIKWIEYDSDKSETKESEQYPSNIPRFL